MVRTRTTAAPTTTTGRKPSLLSRLAGKKTTQNARVTESTSRNPITGTTTTTRKTTTHPSGIGHHGHAGKGPLATKSTATRGTTTTRSKGVHTTQHRKPSMGDKISGGLMNLKGSLTGKPGVKAAGTRRAHGTDGRGTRRVY
ncbi:hypothetical protein Q7P35_001147 [Cladosporium inversicolor]